MFLNSSQAVFPWRCRLVEYLLSVSRAATIPTALPERKEQRMNSLSMEVGAIGIWTAQFDYQPTAQVREAAAELEQLGFGAIWFPESVGRESLTHAALLLGATSRI